MSDFNHLLLDAFPEAALLARQGLITAVNPLARHYLPQLEAGAPLPEYMAAPLRAPNGAGTFTAGLSRYDFSLRDMGGGETLVLFHPAPQSALTDTQLDGALRQMRQLLNNVLVSIDQQTQLPASLPKSYYQMFRLLNNLEFLRSAADWQGVDFRPVTMDLAGLCRQVTDAAAPLLADQGIQLTFASPLTSLLVPGDPQLLQRLLLELITNSVRAVGKGYVRLSLSLQGKRALLSLSDSGAAPTPRQLAAMVQQDSDQFIPTPGSGAGLGLPIARHIAALHGGSMLVEWGQSGPTVFLTLPAGPLAPRATVNTPACQTDGGLPPLLVALADVLPASLFRLDDLE